MISEPKIESECEDREEIVQILQDIRVSTRELEDYRELNRYKQLIKIYEIKLKTIDDIC